MNATVDVVSFVVVGDPKTKGSTRSAATPSGRIATWNDCKGEPLWAAEVKMDALLWGPKTPWSEAVILELHFWLPRPKKLVGQPDHATRPDIDKLTRSVLDALSGILYEDDGRVRRLVVEKDYCRPGEEPRVEIMAALAPREAA